ncbi:MAG: hypothetical protein AAGA77_21250 [Bacteroidota bacterium]
MGNTKGNAYPLWIINNEGMVQSVDSQQKLTNQSKSDFAIDIGISEDGTVWVLSNEADPDGGGARVYWSNGDSTWNEIATKDPGGIMICGYTGSSCLILTDSGSLLNIQTDGSSALIYAEGSNYMAEFAYGGDKIWAMMNTKEGDIPSLHYANLGDFTTWHSVGDEVYYLNSLSVGQTGRCFGIEDDLPVYYDTDGSTGSAGSMGSHFAINISVKNGNFVLSADGNPNGNLVYEWTSYNEGSYSAMNIRAFKICATYYS